MYRIIKYLMGIYKYLSIIVYFVRTSTYYISSKEFENAQLKNAYSL